jgi:hypothetical protein
LRDQPVKTRVGSFGQPVKGRGEDLFFGQELSDVQEE